MYFDYQKDQDWYLGPKHQWNVRICFDIIFMLTLTSEESRIIIGGVWYELIPKTQYSTCHKVFLISLDISVSSPFVKNQ